MINKENPACGDAGRGFVVNSFVVKEFVVPVLVRHMIEDYSSGDTI